MVSLKPPPPPQKKFIEPHGVHMVSITPTPLTETTHQHHQALTRGDYHHTNPMGRFRYIAWVTCPYRVTVKASAPRAGKRAPS